MAELQITNGASFLVNVATTKPKFQLELQRPLSYPGILKTPTDKHTEVENSTLLTALSCTKPSPENSSAISFNFLLTNCLIGGMVVR